MPPGAQKIGNSNGNSFVVCSLVLIYNVIGHNTINIPKYFRCSRFSKFESKLSATDNSPTHDENHLDDHTSNNRTD